jgi:hypothetical protein
MLPICIFDCASTAIVIAKRCADRCTAAGLATVSTIAFQSR